MENEVTNCTPVMDAWTVNGSFLWQAAYFEPYLVDRLEELRRAAGLIPRFYVAPLSSQNPVAAKDVVFLKIPVPPGTVLWGLAFYVDNLDGYAVQIEETGGRQIFNEPISPGNSPGLLYPFLLEPFTVSEIGTLDVTIASRGASTGSDFPFIQLLLLCAAPANVETSVCP